MVFQNDLSKRVGASLPLSSRAWQQLSITNYFYAWTTMRRPSTTETSQSREADPTRPLDRRWPPLHTRWNDPHPSSHPQ